jgi:hypothetical protein
MRIYQIGYIAWPVVDVFAAQLDCPTFHPPADIAVQQMTRPHRSAALTASEATTRGDDEMLISPPSAKLPKGAFGGGGGGGGKRAKRSREEPKEARRGCAIAIAILGRWPPGFFWLFAIRELVSNKLCVIHAASWWVSGDGQCRDEAR